MILAPPSLSRSVRDATMKLLLLTLAFFILPLSGCLSHAQTASSTSPPTATAAPAGHAGQNGAAGRDGTPAPPPGGNVERKEILSQDFDLNSAQPSGPIPVTVPQGAVKVLLSLDYGTGAYQDASFTLGDCKNVSPVTGTTIS